MDGCQREAARATDLCDMIDITGCGKSNRWQCLVQGDMKIVLLMKKHGCNGAMNSELKSVSG